MLIDEILPYERNARDNSKAVPVVAESIKEFGLRGQIVLESRENPVIVAGHTRWAACKSLGWTEIPDEKIDFADDLTEDQIKAYRLADNRTGEVATWNRALLKTEVRQLEVKGLDMSRFNFDFKSKVKPFGDEAMRSERALNLHLMDRDECSGRLELPIVEAVDAVPSSLIPFNHCMSAKGHSGFVHFCIDDYQFERIWNQPEKYLELIRRFDGAIMPDFSIYRDMPYPMKLWQLYRGYAMAWYWQQNGVTVIPSLAFSDATSYSWIFENVPRHSTLFVSSVGAYTANNMPYFINGLLEGIKECAPDRLIFYGKIPDIDLGDLEIVHFDANTHLYGVIE